MTGLSRRAVLGMAAAGVSASGAAQWTPPLPNRKLKAVFAGGHPGDPEYGCGGTIARYTQSGHEAVLLYLNRGDWGFLQDPAKAPKVDRVTEAENACKVLNARPVYASQLNGKAVVDHARAAEFKKLLEVEAPDVIFTQWPIDNHADHRAIYALVYEAWSLMRTKPALYFYEVSSGEDTLMFAPTDYVDITPVAERKRAACYAHASQSPDRYYDMQMKAMAFRGLESGYRYAEAYIRHVHSPDGYLPARA